MGRVVEGTGGQRSSAGAGELKTTNAMLRSVIDGIADPVFAKDAEGRYLLDNPAATEDEQAQAERRRLFGRVHEIQEEERGRVAVGLHDGPLQGLATLGFKLARAKELLADGQTGAAMAALGACEADVAGEVEVRLEQTPAGDVVLAVADDGCGFDRTSVAGGGGRFQFGLTVMAERVEALGGRLAVRARDEGGTVVEASIPGPPPSTGGPPGWSPGPPQAHPEGRPA